MPDSTADDIDDKEEQAGKPPAKQEDAYFDIVEHASAESFPASDPPGWMFNDDDAENTVDSDNESSTE